MSEKNLFTRIPQYNQRPGGKEINSILVNLVELSNNPKYNIITTEKMRNYVINVINNDVDIYYELVQFMVSTMQYNNTGKIEGDKIDFPERKVDSLITKYYQQVNKGKYLNIIKDHKHEIFQHYNKAIQKTFELLNQSMCNFIVKHTKISFCV